MTSKRRWGRWILGILCGCVALCAGGLWVIADAVRSEEAPPELRSASARTTAPRPRPRRRVTSTAPAADGCSLSVQILTVDGEPVPGADVQLSIIDDPFEVEPPVYDEQAADADGQLRWEGLPCQLVVAEARTEALRSGARLARLGGEAADQTLTIEMLSFARLEGVVTDPDGAPIPEASVVSAVERVKTDHRGRYAIEILSAAELSESVSADALGYRAGYFELPGSLIGDGEPDPGEVYVFDLTLQPVREVQVWCVGLPEDRCNDMMLTCTAPYSLFGGDSCAAGGEEGATMCTCDVEGDVTIRGGGRSVLVPEGEHEAWLDFRNTGGIKGQVLADGLPTSRCEVVALRLPYGLEDLPRGLVNAHRVDCEEDGHFELQGLSGGDWELVVDGDLDEESIERELVPRRVTPGQTTDIGQVDLRGGGTVEGVLLDGLTDAPMPQAPIMARRIGGEGERSTFSGADSRQDGTFVMDGLPPGRWQLFHVFSPHEVTEVVVEDGVITDGVEVITAQATSLDANGFALVEEDGVLIVDRVDPGSPADEAGLREGDEIEGIQLAGFDLSGALGGDGPDLGRLLLGSWDGPGVSLTVNRDGEPVDVPLSW